MPDIIIKQSVIHGKGIFAGRDFKKGEIILRWKPRVINKSELANLSEPERKFIFSAGPDTYYHMQEPERFVNHSCENNTTVQDACDVAIRDIKAGEEITANYNDDGIDDFVCNCKTKHCRGRVH